MARAPKTNAAKTHQVTIGNTGATIACRADQTILQAAVAAGIDFPYTCASGNCGTCVSTLDSGKVDMLAHGDAALSPAQIADRQVLACRARPRSAVALTWRRRSRA